MHRPRLRVRATPIVALLAGSAIFLTGCSASSAQADTPRPTPSVTATPVALAHVDKVSPSDGSLSGGDTITISGTGLGGADAVTVGGRDAHDVTAVDENTVTAVVPRADDYQSGTVDVKVFAGTGEDAEQIGSPTEFTYKAVTGVDRQMEYALTYWDDYNDEKWGDYNPLGGDCANFVSQTLKARGWDFTSTWYNNDGKASSAWSFVPSMDDWLSSGAVDVTRLTMDQRDQVKVGDVAVFSWSGTSYRDHVMIVSDVIEKDDGPNVIKLAGHNDDDDFRDLDETLTKKHPGGTAWFYSVPE